MKFSAKILTVLLFGIVSLNSDELPYRRAQKSTPKAVTYDLDGGRFGDKLLGYLHAKWISYRYNIPLLYKPFIYSEQLNLDKLETHYTPNHLKKFTRFVRPTYESNIDYETNISTLFTIPYFPENLWEHTPEERWYYFPVNWEDNGFKQELRKMISSKQFQPSLNLPRDRCLVAVHVRMGGGFDDDDTWKKIPLKLPPASYYEEQILYLYEILNHEPLYIHVFTDDKNPEKLVERFQEYTKDLDIQYGCRTQGNAHNANVLDDFFEMTRFDYMIRPDSNFSIVASKLGDFKVVISPLNYTWTDSDTCHIDETEVYFSKNFGLIK